MRGRWLGPAFDRARGTADATRELLLRSATEIFAEHGFAGARVDEIAERAGVNKSLIYAYYGDKVTSGCCWRIARWRGSSPGTCC